MQQYQFHLHIPAEEFLDYYRGTARHVVAQATSGQTVKFPASLLQKFVTPNGVQGDFVLTCDDNHKAVGLEKKQC